MTRKKNSLTVEADLSDLFSAGNARENKSEEDGFSISQALDIVIKQMKAEGRRLRTIADYERHVLDFVKKAEISAMEDVSAEFDIFRDFP